MRDAQRRSFAAAAAELGMSPSAVSHAVRQVEERLGASLFNRTTRSFALSEAGQALIESVSPALREIDEKFAQIRALKGRVSGLLRINAPRIALPLVITPLARALAERFPDLTLEVYADDALSDIVGSGFDAGVRLGGFIAEDMATARLTPPLKTALVASPAYLAERGRPKAVGDLKNHNCIGFRLSSSGRVYRWELREAGRDVTIETRSTILTNDSAHARDLAFGRRRRRLYVRSRRQGRHRGGTPDWRLARDGDRGAWALLVLSQSRREYAQVARLHRYGEGAPESQGTGKTRIDRRLYRVRKFDRGSSRLDNHLSRLPAF
jgi:DNA-binding transcriptional LysR family regulator